MPITFSTPMPNEKGTAVLEIGFTDEDGNAVTPSSITWTLADINGTIINGRNAISITPAPTVNIVMFGDDLTLDIGTGTIRVVTVEWTYSSSYGSNLSGKDQATFMISDLLAIS